MANQKSLANLLALGFGLALIIAGISYGYVKYIIPARNENKNANYNINSSISNDLKAFKTMAQKTSCADKRNDLYLIDGKMIFWAREGSCADAGYSYILFGQTPDEILCSRSDSLVGPQEKCNDVSFQELFKSVETRKDDLGLSPAHVVIKVN